MINNSNCLIGGVNVCAQLIFSFVWSGIAIAVNQTTRKKTTENWADWVFFIFFVGPFEADLGFRKGLIRKKKQNCIYWAHMQKRAYSHIAVTSQECTKRVKAISFSHNWHSKLTPIDSSCNQLSESYFPRFIWTFLTVLRALQGKIQNGFIPFFCSLATFSRREELGRLPTHSEAALLPT